MNGFVKRFERGNMIVDLGNLEAILPLVRMAHERLDGSGADERRFVSVIVISKLTHEAFCRFA